MKWTVLCRRTNDPKLKWLERELELRGIPYKRNGQSSHAPILEVGADYKEEAQQILDTRFDDIPDDHPLFGPIAGWSDENDIRML